MFLNTLHTIFAIIITHVVFDLTVPDKKDLVLTLSFSGFSKYFKSSGIILKN
jgi:uncharacterized membrane protein